MDDVTLILNSIENGDAKPEELLPAVYEELRRMAAHRMAGEAPGHTLQATALVHEAWMRLDRTNEIGWETRAHFFGAASEAMRRILVDHARKKKSEKRGSGMTVENLEDNRGVALTVPADELLAVNEALDLLNREDPKAAELVKLRYFVGMTMAEAAETLGMKKRSAEALWTYAKVCLKRFIEENA